jgi:Cof subfamily protein (haloacid dehalogenase superfamily)
MHPPLRLVAIDLDGTLLDSMGHDLSERNFKALRAAEAAGIRVAIATGRRMAYASPVFERHGFSPEMPIISSNGAVTRTLGGTLLSQHKMSADVARELCGILRPFGVVVFTFDRAGSINHRELVVEDLDETSRHIALWAEANRDAIEVVNPLEAAFDSGEDPIQGMVAGSIAQMRKAEAALAASPLSKFCAAIRTEYPARDLSIVDLMPPGISKGVALRELCAVLNIDRKATMAIGDNWNDLDMLEWVAQAVLMANSAPELKTRAKLEGWKIAPSNVEDGVAVILERALVRQQAQSTI